MTNAQQAQSAYLSEDADEICVDGRWYDLDVAPVPGAVIAALVARAPTAADRFRVAFVKAMGSHMERGFIVEELALAVRWYAPRIGKHSGLSADEAAEVAASWDVRDLARDVRAAA